MRTGLSCLYHISSCDHSTCWVGECVCYVSWLLTWVYSTLIGCNSCRSVWATRLPCGQKVCLINKISDLCGRKTLYLMIQDGIEEIEMLAFTWIEPSATGLSYDHQAFPIFYLMSLAFNGAIHTHRRGWNPAVTGNWSLICDHQALPVFYLCYLYWMVQGEETENLAVASDRALALSLSGLPLLSSPTLLPSSGNCQALVYSLPNTVKYIFESRWHKGF